MSWPHILSFSRIVAGPIVAVLILRGPGDDYLAAAIVFGLATLTDMIDGKVARYAQRVSPLGIFLDTTADKVFVGLTLIAMALAGLAGAWIPLVVVGREFLISGLRSFAAAQGQIISAHAWGKGKTAVTMIAIFCVLVTSDGASGGILAHLGSPRAWQDVQAISGWLLGVGAILTIISGIRYLVDAWPLFRGARAAEQSEDEQTRLVAGRDG